MLSDLKTSLRKPLLPLARWLDEAGTTPNQITIAGLLASVLSGIALAFDSMLLGLIWLLVALLCDMLDGDIARLSPGKATPSGAFLDSNADRISEAMVFGGLLIGKLGSDTGWLWLTLWVLALTGSFMVSYARARAEGLGVGCSVGIAERPERMIILMLMLIFGFGLSGWFLFFMAGLTWYTVYQRVSHVIRNLDGTGAESE